MGSGCTSNCPSIFQQGPTDKTITYTGPAITSLGICTNDTLSEIEAIVLQKLVDFSQGIGINIPDIDLSSCDLFKEFITCCEGCTDLNCLMNVIFTSLCILDSRITTVEDLVNDLLNGPYDKGCLSNLGNNPTLKQIIQELILEFCALKSQVTALQTQVNNLSNGLNTSIGNFLRNALLTCQTPNIVKSGTGASFTASFNGFVPIGAIMPYAGPVQGIFDTNGNGLANGPLCGYHLANGLDGTTDMREETPVGAGAGAMGGGTLPSNTNGANYSTGLLFGQATVTLASNQCAMPAHSHTITDKSHDHVFQFANRVNGRITSGGANNYVDLTGVGNNTSSPSQGRTANPGYVIGYIEQAFTGITSTNASGAISATTPVENRQPSRALLFIQRMS